MADASQRRRARGRGRWSGAEAKHSFLLSCLCDEELSARLDELRGVSPWWAWLNPQTMQATPGEDEEEEKVAYLCPTYVLYDALSTEGRGGSEWDPVN